MMNSFHSLLLLLFVVKGVSAELNCSFDLSPFDEHNVVEPTSVASLDLNAYSGRWFQMYASLIPNKTFEKSGKCITADYSFIRSTPKSLYVRNTMMLESGGSAMRTREHKGIRTSSSEFVSVRALALQRTSTKQQGLFQLLMGESEIYTKSEASHDFQTCIGNYRIVALGPKDEKTGKYKWAVVSTPFKTSLFIIARDIKDFKKHHDQIVLRIVTAMGFNKAINKPLETYQGDDCKYIPMVVVD